MGIAMKCVCVCVWVAGGAGMGGWGRGVSLFFKTRSGVGLSTHHSFVVRHRLRFVPVRVEVDRPNAVREIMGYQSVIAEQTHTLVHTLGAV